MLVTLAPHGMHFSRPIVSQPTRVLLCVVFNTVPATIVPVTSPTPTPPKPAPHVYPPDDSTRLGVSASHAAVTQTRPPVLVCAGALPDSLPPAALTLPAALAAAAMNDSELRPHVNSLLLSQPGCMAAGVTGAAAARVWVRAFDVVQCICGSGCWPCDPPPPLPPA